MLAPEIIAKAKSNSSDANGRHCKYYQINRHEGLKLWNDKQLRDDAYDTQSYCHSIGLAPYVGTKVEIETCEGTKYGYITEHLTLVCDDVKSRHKLGSNEYFEATTKAWEKVYKLKDRYKEFGVVYNDDTLFNTGIMSNGEYCAIDFGDFVLEDVPF